MVLPGIRTPASHYGLRGDEEVPRTLPEDPTYVLTTLNSLDTPSPPTLIFHTRVTCTPGVPVHVGDASVLGSGVSRVLPGLGTSSVVTRKPVPPPPVVRRPGPDRYGTPHVGGLEVPLDLVGRSLGGPPEYLVYRSGRLQDRVLPPHPDP